MGHFPWQTVSLPEGICFLYCIKHVSCWQQSAKSGKGVEEIWGEYSLHVFVFFPLAMHLDFHHHCIVNSRIDDSQVTVDELAAELSTEGLIAPRNNPSRLVVSNMFYFP